MDEKQQLIKEFKEIENKLLKVLKLSEINLDELEKRSAVKKAIKSSIEAVEEAKKLFAEYESIAKQIESFDKADVASHEREVKKKERQERKLREEYDNEIVANALEVKVVKKKKSNSSAKQM